MPMKMIEARQVPGVGYRFRVHLDTTKFAADGTTPNPEWVLTYTWGDDATRAPGQTPGQYRASVLAQLRALAALERDKRLNAAGNALPDEGSEF